MRMKQLTAVLALALCAVATLAGAQEKPWDQTKDLVYGESKGQTLYLDVYAPNGKGKHAYLKPGDGGEGLGLVDVISGGWNSRRARQEEHERAALFDILCARGYTVFAIRPGSLPDYTALEMVDNLKRGIRWVKAHAEEYGIDPKRLGLMGASAGGHLSLMTMLHAEPGNPGAGDALERLDTNLKAVGVFFPPTDFIDYGGKPADPGREPDLIGGLEGKTDAEIREQMTAISPARILQGKKTPPVMLVHGDKDPIVPLQQSEAMVRAMEAAGNEVELVVKKGGGHFWLTIPQETILLADWFDRQLAKE